MLGWEVEVYRRRATDHASGLLVARWTTSMGGLDWIHELVREQRAVDLGGNGYPCRFSMAASTFLSVVKNWKWPPEGHALPVGWNMDLAALSKLGPNEELVIEAWDQS